MKIKIIRLVFFIQAILILLITSSCKKETSCENCAGSNTPPIAEAGSDQIISLPADSVFLDGSASRDPDGSLEKWSWKKISGPASFTVSKPSESKTVIRNLVAGTYQFELQVTDNGGLSANDTIQIAVNGTGPSNLPPVANAGPDQSITLPANTVNLDGSASTDPENNIASYAWSKISGPSSYNFTSAATAQTNVTLLVAGEYQFELRVTDALGLIDKDTTQVKVNPETANSLVDIYVAGDANGVPVYWKNGQAIVLDNSYYTGMSIAVVGSEVFVAGTRHELIWSNYAAKYWKNGQGVALGDDAASSSIAVAGSDIYVAGWEWEYNGSAVVVIAKYWKNGQAVSLTNGNAEAYANSIAVIGNDVYVAGQEGAFAKYWKNGQAVSLSQGVATSITVIGSDVYVAGYDGGIAKYWKNGQAVSLSAGIATSIFVAGSDVYVAGYLHMGQWNSLAKYWKNGQEVTLTNGSEAYAKSITVVDNDVYVAGFEAYQGQYFAPKYWKNGQAVSLPSSSNSGLANCIVVIKR